MTTPTNWPNPERPGVPLFPERDGWHWLSYGQNQEPVPFEWRSEEFSDAPTEWAWGTDDGPEDAYEMARRFCYHGPCLTPAQIAEMLAWERERCANIFQAKAEGKRKILPDLQKEKNALKAVQQDITYLEKYAEEIRNLGAAP